MNFNQKLDLLISLGKETKTLKVEDVTRYFEKDSKEYRTVVLELEHKGIEVLDEMDLEVDFPEDDENIDGVMILLNTMGGDVEAGLAIAELISSMSKPTVSLVLGGGHSIGIPLAVCTKKSFITVKNSTIYIFSFGEEYKYLLNSFSIYSL